MPEVEFDEGRILPESFYVKFVQDLQRCSKNYRLNWENRAKEAWRVYRQEYDFSAKRPWQAKTYIPKLTKAVEVAAAILKVLTVQSRAFFSVDPIRNTPVDLDIAKSIERVLWHVLEENRFVESFYEALIVGLVTGMLAYKVYWHTEQNIEWQLSALGLMPSVKNVAGVRIDLVDPLDLYLDWTGKDTFAIHEFYLELSTVKALAEVGYFDPDKVKELKGSGVEDWAKTKGTFIPTSPYKKHVKIWEFWGTVTDEDGNIIHPNAYMVIADEDKLLRGPIPNPYAPFRHPFIIAAPFYRPFLVYHKGLVHDAIELQRALNEFMNFMIDASRYHALPIFVVQLDMLARPEDILEGIMPGKTVLLSGAIPPNASPVTAVNVGGITQEIVNIYAILEREIQNATGITELLMGTQSARGRPTATEIVTGREQATALVEVIGRNIEDQLLEPLLQRIWVILTRFRDQVTDEELKELLDKIEEYAQELEDPSEVWTRPYKFRARGITTIMQRAAQINKLASFLQLIQAFPDATLAIKWYNLLVEMIKSLQWQPDEVLIPEEEFEAKKQQMMMMQQMMAMLQQASKGKKRGSKRAQERPGTMTEAIGGEMPRTE